MRVVTVARKPCAASSTTANVVEHETGAINVDGCRIGSVDGGRRDGEASRERRYIEKGSINFAPTPGPRGGDARGRWPANVILVGDEVVVTMGEQSGVSQGTGGSGSGSSAFGQNSGWNKHNNRTTHIERHNDEGTAARYFKQVKP